MNEIRGIKTGWLVISSEKTLRNCGMIFRNGKIEDIVPNEMMPQGSDILDASPYIICHAFADMHTHLYSSILGNKALPEVPLIQNLEQFWWPELENRQTSKLIELSVAYSAMRHLAQGAVFVNDILEAPLADWGSRLGEEEQVLKKAGMKGILALESNERISCENGMGCLDENEEFVKAHLEDEKIRGAICTHTAFSCSTGFLKNASERAENWNALLEFHMNEGPYEDKYCRMRYGMGTADYYADIGFWKKGSRIFACQCSDFREEDILTAAEYGVGISTQPASNAAEGSGIADVQKMLEKGMKISLGSDAGEGNPFELMRLLLLMQRGMNGFTDEINEKNIYKIATENGPSSVGFMGNGTLEKGMAADFMVLRNSSVPKLNTEEVIPEIIWHMNPDSIKSVYTDGECVFTDGHSVRLDDQKIIDDFRNAYEEFWKEESGIREHKKGGNQL